MIRAIDDSNPFVSPLPKSPTGISGFDEITGGGLPQGRPAIVCGSAGAGKTLFSVEFLVRGATLFNEPGVFIAFEESPEELIANVASLGFDLGELIANGQIAVDYVQTEHSEIEETGEYDLDGLFIRLNYAIDSVGAKRVVLDTLESLFGTFTDSFVLRSEMRRLFRWLKSKGVTAIITAEKGDGTLTRHGLEEYVSDCVILLDHRVTEQISTRRLRVVKYRGSAHGTNEYPFLIDNDGFSVLPITSVGLNYEVSTERVSTGIPQLDTLLEGKGYYRGSTILVSGTAGSGKSSVAAHFALEVSRQGKRCLYLASEEPMSQIIRNMRSIGIDLEPSIEQGLLQFYTARPTSYGLEMYLAIAHKLINEFQPDVVIIDPISNLIDSGTSFEVKSLLLRLVDFLKVKQITVLITSLSHGEEFEHSNISISSLIDTWLLLQDTDWHGERNRVMYLLKSRGMAHSHQMHEFTLTSNGIEIILEPRRRNDPIDLKNLHTVFDQPNTNNDHEVPKEQ